MGQIGAPFGVRGWVHIYADTEYPDSLMDYPVWQVGMPGNWRAVPIEDIELHAKSIVVKFEGVADRDAAALLRNLQVGILRSEMPEPDENEYYWTDLIGLAVINLQDEHLGTVTQLFETGANDVLVVRDGETERLLPFVASVVQSVDLSGRKIVVDWGLDY
nr:ribosome maturation factor RimM [Chitinivorax tropicus]